MISERIETIKNNGDKMISAKNDKKISKNLLKTISYNVRLLFSIIDIVPHKRDLSQTNLFHNIPFFKFIIFKF